MEVLSGHFIRAQGRTRLQVKELTKLTVCHHLQFMEVNVLSPEVSKAKGN